MKGVRAGALFLLTTVVDDWREVVGRLSATKVAIAAAIFFVGLGAAGAKITSELFGQPARIAGNREAIVVVRDTTIPAIFDSISAVRDSSARADRLIMERIESGADRREELRETVENILSIVAFRACRRTGAKPEACEEERVQRLLRDERGELYNPGGGDP